MTAAASTFARTGITSLTVIACTALAPLTVAAQRADTLRLPLLWSVIEGEHPTADSLGEITGIAMDASGNVYVSDFAEHKLWVFDARGRSQRGIGRKGDGPGEFQAPTGIAIGPDRKLYVRDQEHVTRFAADAETGRLSRYETRYNGGAMNDWMSTLASRFDAQGRLYYPNFNLMDRSRQMGQWWILDAAGRRVDSIGVPVIEGVPPGWAVVRLSASGGRILPGLNHVPFAGMPSWDVTPRGTVLYTSGREYLVREVDRSGRLLREFRRSTPAIRISANERRDSLAALRVRLDSISNIPRAQITGVPDEVWAQRLPETYPPIIDVFAAPDGLVWLRRWVPNGHLRSVFDVFNADGSFRTVVELPAHLVPGITPSLTLDAVAGIGIDSETGAMTVLRFGRAP
ncbi:MAG TPA: 6-bladed beta-propeller [Gemmatimonadaceae bacterium]|nr:6-bladed beta-propeller [Gemmatimonadaceae bacterium]